MLSLNSLISLSFICSGAGFTVTTAPLRPPSLPSFSPTSRRSYVQHRVSSFNEHLRAPMEMTWASPNIPEANCRWAARTSTGGSRRKARSTLAPRAAASEEPADSITTAKETTAAAATPRLKRVRKRRKDADSTVAPTQDEGGVVMPANGVAEPVQATAPVEVAQEVAPAVPQPPKEKEPVMEEKVEPVRSSAQTKGTKVRVTDDGDDGIDVGGIASKASNAAGDAAKSISNAAKSAVGSAMSALGQGDASTLDIPENIPDEFKDYVSTYQRMEEGSGESQDLDLSELSADIARFRAKEGKKTESLSESVAGEAKGIISTIIAIDFFVVIIFMLWFIAGVVSSYGFKNTFLLDEFNASWNPIVQPALGVLMGGTILGGVLSKLREAGDEDNEKSRGR